MFVIFAVVLFTLAMALPSFETIQKLVELNILFSQLEFNICGRLFNFADPNVTETLTEKEIQES